MKAIPRLVSQKDSSSLVTSFCHHLEESSYQGDCDQRYAARLSVATDNSMYQVLPESVLFPKSTEDIVLIFKLGSESSYKELTFSFRGGGTATNGQSLHSGLVIDCSRYMTQVLELNVKEKWVRVQPGLVLDQLNDILRPHGLCVGPTVSPSSRATIGGMVSTDACGQGSRCYGRMSEHIRSLTAVLSNGELIKTVANVVTQDMDFQDRTTRESRIFATLPETLATHHDEIQARFPKMKRFLTGYNLDHTYQNGTLNLNALLAGSEGTLAGISEVELSVVSLPKYHYLLALGYSNLDAALAEAEVLLDYNPLAIETVDHHILSLVQDTETYQQALSCLGCEKGESPFKSMNLLSFAGDKKKELADTVQTVLSQLTAPYSYLTMKPSESAIFWDLRKQAVGVLARTKGTKKALPFIEDTAVPPEHLRAYIHDLQQILEKEGVKAAVYGHADVGCLHVRPFLAVEEEGDQKKLRQITDQVIALVDSYNGVMWAEHGRGYRSRYTSQVFGHDLHQVLRQIKELFDPENKLNPGKIVTPFSMPDTLVDIDHDLRAVLDKEIPYHRQESFRPIMDCNGNGACFHYHPDYVMCPSYKVSQDRVHSPKGRATIFREWLRLYSRYESLGELPKKGYSFFQKFIHTLQKSEGHEDFSVDVFDAMHGCLNCKACATQCPAHVDIPTVKTRFLKAYYTRYLRPFRDHVMCRFESFSRVFARYPRSFNRLMHNPISKWMMHDFLGLTPPPRLSSPSLQKRLKLAHIPEFSLSVLKTVTPQRQSHTVLLMPDSFNAYYRVDLVLSFYTLLKELGKDVYLLPSLPSGKSAQVLGMMPRFKKEATVYMDFLSELSAFSFPIIGLDPAMVLNFRDDYPKLLGESFRTLNFLLPQEYLINEQKALSERAKNRESKSYYLLGHCIEKTIGASSFQLWKPIFKAAGLSLDIVPVGCCGMAGMYGYEKEHFSDSKEIFQQSWQSALQEKAEQNVLATGFSCYHQVQRLQNKSLQHPLAVL